MSKKNIDIYDAITNLPDELITREIYEAAIKEANIKLLNILPEEYMTEDNINYILDNTGKHYSWNSFKLSAIPEKARTQKVCDIAVRKSLENYFIVPFDKRSAGMLQEVMNSAHKRLHYLPHVPETSWSMEHAIDGIKSIYSSGNSSSGYNSRHYSSSSSSDKKTEMKLIQILLAYVPEALKTKELYFSLFGTGMTVEYIDFLMPGKYKQNDYFLEVGRKNIHAVPKEKLGYDILKAALLSDKNRVYDFFDEEKGLKEPLMKVIDDEIADIIIQQSPGKLGELPQQFWKKNRLILAINNENDSYRIKNIYEKFDISKFDDEICRAIVLKENYDCPEFAPHIWTQGFINFCMENCQGYYWFRRLPVELQTQKMVNTILGKYISKIQYARHDLITYELAVEAYKVVDDWRGGHKLENYIPKHFFEDFVLETGLPKEFFAGRVNYSSVKEGHKNFTFFEIGESYIGFFKDKDGREEYNRLIMTRRSPVAIKPSIVFNRTVSTFHKTWLEKLIADNDSQFSKPVPSKGLKGRQLNPYLDVKHVDTAEGTKIYAHSLMGSVILYTAGEYNEYETTSLEIMRKRLIEKLQECKTAS